MAAARIRCPTRGNRRLETLLDAANADDQLKAWWHVAQVNAERLGMSDHSWVHIQIVVNIALRLCRLLVRRGVEPARGARLRDGRPRTPRSRSSRRPCCIAWGWRSTGPTTRPSASSWPPTSSATLLAGIYDEPERSVISAEAMHAIIAHRRRGDPLTLEAGIVRVADALDMAKGRSRVPFEAGRPNIHSLSAAAIDEVRIDPGKEKAVRIEIDMNNSSGIFQIDELLATKLRGSGLEDHVEVIARIEAEHEKRLVPLFRL